ncbi:hypothetical protein FRC08_002616, partial [Ceratobasidium sp. 394]
MTISDSSVGEDWIASPSSLALSLGRSPFMTPAVAEVLPPGLDQPAARAPASSTFHRSTTVSSVDSVSSSPDVSPPQLLAPSIPGSSSLYRSDSVSSVGTLSTVSDLPPLHAPHHQVLSTTHSPSLSTVGSISASVPSIRDALRIPAPSTTLRSRSLSSEPSISASVPSIEGTPRLQVPSTTHRSRSISSEDSLSASLPSLRATPRPRVPSKTRHSRSISSEGTFSASMPSIRGSPRGVPSTTHRSRSISSEDSLSVTMPTIEGTPRVHVPSTTHRSRSISSEDSLSASMPTIGATPRAHVPSMTPQTRSMFSEETLSLSAPSIRSSPHLGVPSTTHRSRSISSEESLSASVPTIGGTPRMHIPSATHRSRSVSSEDSLSVSVPTMEDTPRARVPSTTRRSHSMSSEETISPSLPSVRGTPHLGVPSTTHRSRTLSSERSLSISAPSVISSMVGKTSVESPLSPTVSSISFTTMPTIIAPPAAPPTPSPVESPSLTTISSLTTTVPITPSAPVRRNGSVRSMWTMESDRTYDSADLRPSPPYIPIDLPPEAEYEPSYSGLEGTMSVISYASPGYDVVRHHVSPPSAASMDSGLVDYSSPEAMSRGSDRRPSLTPSRVEGSLSSETTITLPPLPPSPERTPSLHTTQPSSISFTTPEGNKPSIESEETVYSDHDLDEGGIPPSHIISHDVNRLLQYLHDIDTAREGETRDMSDHLRRIEEELFDLSAFLRTRRPTPPPAQPQYVPFPVEVPAPAPAPTPVVVPMPIPVPVEAPVRQPPPIPPRPVVEHEFEDYVPMSDASTDVSLSERAEEPTPIAAPVPPRPVSEVSSIDLSESLESMSERASTVPSVTLSDESSVSRSMLSSSVITMSPSVSISAISADLLRTPSQSVREPAASPVSLQIPVSPSISSAATPELSPPSSRSSSSAELAGLTPSPSVQPEVLPDVTIKSSSPLLSKSPSISAATERSVTPIPEHVPAKRVQSLSPPPVRRPSPVLSESDYFISSPLSQDTFRDLPRAYSASPSMSVVSIESQGTAKPDSKGSMGIEELRALLKDLLKQQDVVAGRQDDHTALLEELRNRPPPTVVYQAPEISELSEHRVALTKIEHILGDLVDRFDVVRDSISSSSLTRSSTLTSSSETISSSTTSRPT